MALMTNPPRTSGLADTSVSLLERLRDRQDGAAWQRLADLYTPWVRGWLRRYGLQDSDADDLLQEVLGAVVRYLPGFQHNQRPGAFRTWLRTITVNCLRGFWRSQKVRPAATGDSDFLNVLDQLEAPDSGLG